MTSPERVAKAMRSSQDSSSRFGVSRRISFWLVSGAFFVVMLGTTLPTPLYVRYQADFGFSTLVNTALFASYGAGVLAALLLTGSSSDSFGRRRILLLGLGLAMLSSLTFVGASGLAALFAGRVLSGLSAGVFAGTATATLVDLAGSGRAQRATAASTVANMGGLGAGPLLCGLLIRGEGTAAAIPFEVHAGLLLLAIVAIVLIPETVVPEREPRWRFSGVHVPAPSRAVFRHVATATFAGFAVLGLFACAAPMFLRKVLGISDPGAVGLVVASVFAASTLGQLALTPLVGRSAPTLGPTLLIAGMIVLAGSLAASSLPLFVAAAVLAGGAQGLILRAGLGALNATAEPEQRAAVASAFFVVAYAAISLPVIGMGMLDGLLGLQKSGILFCVAVSAVAAASLLAQYGANRSR